MNWLDATNFIEELNILNAEHNDKVIIPVPGTNNTLLVNSNLLEDCNEGQFWFDYSEWLKKLPQTNEVPDIPSPIID